MVGESQYTTSSASDNKGPSPRSTIGVLDIGSSRCSCLIAEVPSRGSADASRGAIKVLGFGQTLARGVHAGAVVNVSEAEHAIRLAVDAAERLAERRLREVYVNVSGGRARSEFCSGEINTQTGVVSPRDIENAISSALLGLNVGRRKVLHLMPASFILDGVPNQSAPLGLHGSHLVVQMAVVTVEPAVTHNIELALERSLLSVAGFALSPYAAGRGALSDDEKSLGSLVVDFGGHVTSYAMFKGGRLTFAGTLPVGGQHVTQDIAQGLSTTMAHAERMKTLFGSVLPLGHEDREFLAVPLAGESGTDTVQQVPKHVLTSIIAPRMEETLLMLRSALDSYARHVGVTTKVVLTGGGSQLHGLEVLAGQVLGLSTRKGLPRVVSALPEYARGPASCVAAGLAATAVYPDRSYAMPKQAQAAMERANLSYVRRVGRWLAESI